MADTPIAIRGSVGTERATLTWQPGRDPGDTYRLYRFVSPDSPVAVYDGTAISYVDLGVRGGVTYSYFATALDGVVESDPTGIIEVTPNGSTAPDGMIGTEPTLSHTATRLYEAMSPVAYNDGDNGWALTHYCAALALQLDSVADLSRDLGDQVGWAVVMDPDTCPAPLLPWLGQFVGVDVPDDISEDAKRLRIKETDGFRRGSVRAVLGAARQTLSGTQTVYITERHGSAYVYTVATWVRETPDPVATLVKVMEQKPGGLLVNFSTIVGGDFHTLRDTHTDFSDIASTFANFSELRDDPSRQ